MHESLNNAGVGCGVDNYKSMQVRQWKKIESRCRRMAGSRLRVGYRFSSVRVFVDYLFDCGKLEQEKIASEEHNTVPDEMCLLWGCPNRLMFAS